MCCEKLHWQMLEFNEERIKIVWDRIRARQTTNSLNSQTMPGEYSTLPKGQQLAVRCFEPLFYQCWSIPTAIFSSMHGKIKQALLPWNFLLPFSKRKTVPLANEGTTETFEPDLPFLLHFSEGNWWFFFGAIVPNANTFTCLPETTPFQKDTPSLRIFSYLFYLGFSSQKKHYTITTW